MEGHVDTDSRAADDGASDSGSASASQLLAELARAFHAVTVPSDLIEALITDIARKHGVQAEAVLFQSAMVMQVGSGSRAHVSLQRMDFDTRFRLAQTHALILLARALVAGTVTVDAARRELTRITTEPPLYSRLSVALASGVYGTAVAARIGGGWLEMAAAMVTGIATTSIHFGGVGDQTSDLQKAFLAGLTGGLCVGLLALVLPPFMLAPAIFGGVALLVPALVVAIGIHELASGALESGVLRLVHALLRFAMLAGGIAAARSLVLLAAPGLPSVSANGLSVGALVVVLFVGGTALVVCLQARPRDAPWIVGAVLLAYGAQELTKVAFGGRGVPMLSAFVVGVAAQLRSRQRGQTTAVVIVPGLLQLTPGFLGTGAAMHLVEGSDPGGQTFLLVLLEAFQLATGLLIARVLFRPRGLGTV